MTYDKHPSQLTMTERRHRHIESDIQYVGEVLHRLLEEQMNTEEKLEKLLIKSREIYSTIERERNDREKPERD